MGFFNNEYVYFMSNQRKRNLLFVALPLILFVMIILTTRDFSVQDDMHKEGQAERTQLEKILERGYIKAITDYNATNYFIYRGKPMGYHLELLQHFAAHLGVDLELQISNDLENSMYILLKEERSDLIAKNIAVTRTHREKLDFSLPHSRTRQVLVQRKPDHWYSMRSYDIEDKLIRSQLDLSGKTIHVHQHAASVTRIRHLMEEIGDSIHLVKRPEGTETLIEEVARGEIDYTVSEEHLAGLHEVYYANIDAQTPLSFEQNLAWAVRKGEKDLVAAINEWLEEFTDSPQYAQIYDRYYNNPRSVFIAKSDLHSLGGGNISVFDDYFKRYADIIGWDWRLIASLSFQESRFNPSAVSWAGAFGIMQLMPETAGFLNVDDGSQVHEHIAAGIRYLKWLDERLQDEIKDDDERVKFVLASYNAGIGHVLDARRLAEKYGKNPNVWRDNVDYFLLNKSDPVYYRDPVVRHGYARGAEPYNYVTEIQERYHHYKNILER